MPVDKASHDSIWDEPFESFMSLSWGPPLPFDCSAFLAHYWSKPFLIIFASFNSAGLYKKRKLIGPLRLIKFSSSFGKIFDLEPLFPRLSCHPARRPRGAKRPCYITGRHRKRTVLRSGYSPLTPKKGSSSSEPSGLPPGTACYPLPQQDPFWVLHTYLSHPGHRSEPIS